MLLGDEVVEYHESFTDRWLPDWTKALAKKVVSISRFAVGLPDLETLSTYQQLNQQNESVDDGRDTISEELSEESSASYFSILLFSWYDSMISLGSSRPLYQSDLKKLLPEHDPDKSCKSLEEEWSQEEAKVSRGEKPKPSLVSTLYKAYRWELLKAFIPRLIKVVGAFIAPWIIKLIVGIIESSPSKKNIPWGLFLLLLLFCSIIISSLALQRYWHITIGTMLHMKAGLTTLLYKKVLRLSAKSKQSDIAGKLTNLISVDVSRIQDTISYLHFLWATPVMTLFCFISIGFLLGPWPAASGFLVLLVFLPATGIIAWKFSFVRRQCTQATDARVKSTNEIFNTMKTVKVYALENHLASKAIDLRSDELKVIRNFQLWKALYSTITFSILPMLSSMSFLTIILQGKTFTASTAFAVMSLYYALKWPISILSQVVSSVVESRVSINRVEEFMSLQEVPGRKENDEILSRMEQGEIQINGGTFHWDKSNGEQPTLENINFQSKKGELTCVIGEVGSGKSSLLNVILGEIEQQGGNTNVKGSICYTPQTPFLLHATVRENITFGLEFNEAKYKRVIDVCALQPDFDMLVAGDMTTIGERGINLSGGQKARVSMARAVYSDSDIFLLDDPLSAVDAHVGHKLFNECIKGMLKDKNVILVTHQLQYVTHGNKLVIMQDGKISKQGSPEALQRQGIDIAALLERFNTLQDSGSNEGGPEHANGMNGIDQKGSTDGQNALIEMNGSMDLNHSMLHPSNNRVDLTSSAEIQRQQNANATLEFFQSVNSQTSFTNGTNTNENYNTKLNGSEMNGSNEFHLSKSVQKYLKNSADLKRSGGLRLSAGRNPHLRNSSNSIHNSIGEGNSNHSLNGSHSSHKPEDDGQRDRLNIDSLKANADQREERGFGSIGLSVYKFYFSHKWMWWVIAVIMVLGHRGLDVLIKTWLAEWSSSNPGKPPNHRHQHGKDSPFSTGDASFSEFGFIYDLSSSVVSSVMDSVAYPVFGWSTTALSSLSLSQTQYTNGLADDNLSSFASNSSGTDPGSPSSSQSPRTFIMVYVVGNLILALLMMVKETWILMITFLTGKHVYMVLFQRLLRAPMAFFDTTPKGRIAARFSSDTDAMDNQLGGLLSALWDNVVQIVCSLISIGLTIHYFVFGMIPMFIAYTNLYNRFIGGYRELARLQSISKAPLFSQFSETLNGIYTLRAYKSEKRFVNILHRNLDVNNRGFFYGFTAARWLGVRMDFLGGILICSVAAFAIFNNSINPGLMGMALSYCLLNTEMLNGLIRGAADVESRMNSVERIEQYSKIDVERPPIIDSYRPPAEWPSTGKIQFDNVCMRYRPGLPLVLNNMNFKINSAEKIGVVGRTGAGKSSILTALLSLCPLASGTVLVDGVDINRIGVEDLRSRLSIIPQDPTIFDGSVRLNIDPFGKYLDADLWSALERVHLKELVESLPMKLDHEMADDGSNFSLGQRQLLCVARAILRRSKILLLDEASSSIDLETDYLLQNTLKSEFSNCTTITIAHRLATIMDSDRVMVLEAGQVKEFDSPAALLQNPNSTFSQLHKQAMSSQEEADLQ